MGVDELILPSGPYEAFLFDLDGTVADSMPLHYLSWAQAVGEAGGQFPEEMFYALGGVPLPRTVEILNERFGTAMDPAVVVARKEGLYLGMLDRLTPVAAVLRVMEAWVGRVPFAIVSGSPRASIEATLARLGLGHYFPLVVGAEDYREGKPAPEPFLMAAARLGVAPERCLVFEDAEAGVQSAVAAGMKWVRIEPQMTVSAR